MQTGISGFPCHMSKSSTIVQLVCRFLFAQSAKGCVPPAASRKPFWLARVIIWRRIWQVRLLNRVADRFLPPPPIDASRLAMPGRAPSCSFRAICERHATADRGYPDRLVLVFLLDSNAEAFQELLIALLLR